MLNESDGIMRMKIAFGHAMRSTNEKVWSLCAMINPELTEAQDPEGPSRVTPQGNAWIPSTPTSLSSHVVSTGTFPARYADNSLHPEDSVSFYFVGICLPVISTSPSWF